MFALPHYESLFWFQLSAFVCVCRKVANPKDLLGPIMKFLSQVNTSAVKQSEQLLLSAFINDYGIGSRSDALKLRRK